MHACIVLSELFGSVGFAVCFQQLAGTLGRPQVAKHSRLHRYLQLLPCFYLPDVEPHTADVQAHRGATAFSPVEHSDRGLTASTFSVFTITGGFGWLR